MAMLLEGANPRHEHEWEVWKSQKLPPDKILIPGVVATTSNYVEAPELLAQRITRFAELVGRERVLASHTAARRALELENILEAAVSLPVEEAGAARE
jgi:methionine synthase II (cobalamin-independent)